MKSTFFIDLDGTLVRFRPEITDMCKGELEPIEGAKEFLLWLHVQGHRVIITTGRPQSWAKATKRQLENLGFMYQDIIFNCGNGPRWVLNDSNAKEVGCAAYAFPRNKAHFPYIKSTIETDFISRSAKD